MIKKAVALKYPKDAPCPFISVKGKDNVAQEIINIAKQNNVPIVENKELTEVLTLEEVGSFVPEETWELIANIFSYIIELDSNI